MRIQLKNRTDVRNEDLRDLFRRSLRAVGYCTKQRWPLEVRVTYGRYSGVSGRATIGRNRVQHGLWVELRIPRPAKWTPDTLREVVAVTVHECMHLVGSQHKDMTEAQRQCTLPLPAWAAGLQLRPKVKEPELPKPQRRAASHAARLQHVEKMLQLAERRAANAERNLANAKRWVTRSQTVLKGWQRKKAALLRSAPLEEAA